MTKKILQNVTVLVTRPEHQAQPFFTMIRRAGGQAILFPVIEIQAIDPGAEAKAMLHQTVNGVIFISANAVHLGVPMLNTINPQWNRDSPVIAIGKATATHLREQGVEPVLTPPAPFNSEALLVMPQMQDIAGHQYTIIKGRGGRRHLQEQIRDRGARVSEIDIYVRVKPTLLNTPLNGLMQSERAVVAITSVKGLHHLFELASTEQAEWLKKSAEFLVPGMRVADTVNNLHIRQAPMIAEDATDEAMYNRLLAAIKTADQA